MGKIERAIEGIRAAPPEVVDQILALLETVRGSAEPAQLARRSEASRQAAKDIEARKGIYAYIGALSGSELFKGDPLEIQKQMRDEWD